MVGNTEEGCRFAIIQTTIESVDDRTVTFTARSTGSGDADQNLRRTFTVPVEEIYTLPIPGAPEAVALKPGATGSLYLSRTGWATTSADGFTLFGARTAIFKWPLCAGIAAPLLTKVGIVPTSISIRGHLEGETAFVEIELLGPDAATSQDVTWNGVELIELALTPRGAQRLRAGTTWSTVKLWPTRIVVKGAPALDPALAGEVDILDPELARAPQRIAFAEAGAEVTLWLTQDGLSAFHVTPQLVAEVAMGLETVACA
jgi:hypothetical protein